MGEITISELENFFFEAHRYGTGPQKGEAWVHPHNTRYSYTWENLTYEDLVYINGDFRGGTIIMYTIAQHVATPVWIMQYQSWFKKNDRINSYLKKYLSKAYHEKVFYGGGHVGLCDSAIGCICLC